MSDTISHATQGGLLLLGPFIAWVRRATWVWILASIGGIFGALPDLIGVYGYLINNDHWALYRSSHHGAIANVLQYVPMYWLHLRVDSITHGPDTRWWMLGERLWLEILFWVVNISCIWWYVRIWKRRRWVSDMAHEATYDTPTGSPKHHEDN